MWTALAVVVIAFIVMQYFAREGLGQEQISDAADTPTPMLRFLGRYAIGTNEMFSKMGQATTGQNPADEMLVQIDEYAVSRLQQLRAIPVVAELKGKDEALERLSVFVGGNAESELNDDAAVLRTIYTEGVESVSDENAQRLVDRHEWFGELALTYDLGSTDAKRVSAVAPGLRTIAFAIVMVICALGFLIGGVALFIMAIVMLSRRRIRSGYMVAEHPSTGARTAYLETVVIGLFLLVGLQVVASIIQSAGGPDLGHAMLWLVLPAPLWPLLRGVKWPELKLALGLHCGRGFWRECGCGVLGYFAGLPVLFAGVVLMFVFKLISELTAPDEGAHPIVTTLPSSPGIWFILFLFSMLCIWAPVVEELLFRGAFYHHVRRRWGAVLSALFVGFIFAAIHPQGFLTIPPLTALAFNIAMVREWRGSIIAPMALHAFNNGIAFTAMCFLFF